MRPLNLTPLNRYMVMFALSFRAVLRNESWMFCAGLFSICPSPNRRKDVELIRAVAQRGKIHAAYHTAFPQGFQLEALGRRERSGNPPPKSRAHRGTCFPSRPTAG